MWKFLKDSRFVWIVCTVLICTTMIVVGSIVVKEMRKNELRRQWDHEDRQRVLEEIRDATEYPPPRGR